MAAVARGLEDDKARYQRLITQWAHGVTAISDLSVGVCDRDLFCLRHRCSRLGRCSVSAASNSTALLSIAWIWRTRVLGAVIPYWPLTANKPILYLVVWCLPRAGGLMKCVQPGGFSSPERDSAVHSTGNYENRRSSTAISCIRRLGRGRSDCARYVQSSIGQRSNVRLG